MYGKDTNDGMEWHKFMLKKCYKPYTDFHGCKIDEREAKLQKMRDEFGEEKFERSEAQVKAMLARKLGPKYAEKVWDYKNDYNMRFKELRKAVDEELGVVRDGQEVPDFENQMAKTPEKLAEKPQDTPKPEENKSKFKGWWSEPESRFKKTQRDS